MFYQYLIFSILIAFLTFLGSAANGKKNGLLLSLFVVFVVIAIRYDFGYDYLMYKKEFSIINSNNIKNLNVGMQRLEHGWILLNKLFGSNGFYFFIAFLSFLYCLIFYIFIRDTLDKSLYALSILLFLIIPGIFIFHLSLLRQTLALLFYFVAIMMVERNKLIIWSVSILLLASFFHFSALILMPLLFTKYIKIKKIHLNIIVVLFLSLFIAVYFDSFTNIIFKLINYTFPKYSHYLSPQDNNKIKINTGLGIIFSVVNFLLIIYFQDKFVKKDSLKIMFFSIVLFYLLIPLSLILGQFGRINLYFEVFQMIFIPLVFQTIENKKIKYIYLTANILFYVYCLNRFFASDVQEQKFNNYKTIFSKEAKI